VWPGNVEVIPRSPKVLLYKGITKGESFARISTVRSALLLERSLKLAGYLLDKDDDNVSNFSFVT